MASGTDDKITVSASTESAKQISDADDTTIQSSTAEMMNRADPMDFGRHRRDNVTRKQMAIEYPKGNKKKKHGDKRNRDGLR